jgi:hypothetical protein
MILLKVIPSDAFNDFVAPPNARGGESVSPEELSLASSQGKS